MQTKEEIAEIVVRKLTFFLTVYFFVGLLAVILVSDSTALAVESDTEITMDDIRQSLQQAEGLTDRLVPLTTAPEGDEQARNAAETIMQRFNEQRRADVDSEQQRLSEELFGEVMALYGRQNRNGDQEQPVGLLAENQRIYLFFSSSIPQTTMRNYLAAAERSGDPNIVLVMRGFVGGMKTVRPTLEYLAHLINKEPGCDPLTQQCDGYQVNIQIDPLLFQRYGIDRVPAVVFATGVSEVESSEAEAAVGPVWKIQGDAALDYLLERINRAAKNETLAGVVRTLQSGR